MKETFNLNHEMIFLHKFKYGHTQNIVIRVGRKLYYLDVEKHVGCAFVEVYGYAKDRNSICKYTTGCGSASCKADAVLNREFFERIAEIGKAQSIIRHFCGVVE